MVRWIHTLTVENRDPEVRSCGRVKNALLWPVPHSPRN